MNQNFAGQLPLPYVYLDLIVCIVDLQNFFFIRNSLKFLLPLDLWHQRSNIVSSTLTGH